MSAKQKIPPLVGFDIETIYTKQNVTIMNVFIKYFKTQTLK